MQRRRFSHSLQVALAAACAASAWLTSAHATPDYPPVIDAVLGTSCPEPLSRCLICHVTARGGQGTAEQLFARKLRGSPYNLKGNEPRALAAALEQLFSLPVPSDSDSDGESDQDELERCGNPSGEDFGVGPVYGCDGAHLAPRAEPDGALGALALGLSGLLVHVARRRANADRSVAPRSR
ncbi:MAG TPA: hypothetical protein VJU61_18920 [Polyangiaceae bacterium]|nr:hypothetical protein [Polyangiaceae bacterium]